MAVKCQPSAPNVADHSLLTTTMADEIEFEEEEFTTKFNGQTIIRILAQTRPHWKWVAGFLILITVVAAMDAYLTYLRKQIIDLGITPGDTAALARIGVIYAVTMLTTPQVTSSMPHVTSSEMRTESLVTRDMIQPTGVLL